MYRRCGSDYLSNMAETLTFRDRPSKGHYKQLHNLTTDIIYKAKTGKKRKSTEDIFYEVERVISQRVMDKTVETSTYSIILNSLE